MALFLLPSYIEIHNNTPDVYCVKVEEDKILFKYVQWAVTAFAVVATVVATAGAAAPVAVILAANSIEICFLSAQALVAITAAAASISGISYASSAVGWALSTIVFLQEKLREDGYVEIRSGEKHKFKVFGNGPLGWRQACCCRVRQNPNDKTQVVMDKVYMRPIFAGVVPFTTTEHDIQFWIHKWGHEDYTVMSLSKDSLRAIQGRTTTSTRQTVSCGV